jgi:hypothetical protein
MDISGAFYPKWGFYGSKWVMAEDFSPAIDLKSQQQAATAG